METKLNHSIFSESSLLLIAPFFLWGTAMVAMKGVLDQTTPLFLAGIRLLPAGILVLAVGILLGRPQPKGWQAWLSILLFALIDGTLFQGFLALGLTRTDAGLGSVMIDSQPLAVALLSSFLFGEIIGVWGWLGLILGILGISLIGLPDELIINFFQGNLTDFTFSWTNLFSSGEWLMLLASLSMAVGTVLIRYVCRYSDPIIATGWHMILGGIPLFIASACWETNQWNNLDLPGILALGYATVFGSAIAYGIFFYLASQENLTSLSALTFLTPVFALLFGNLILAEILSSLQWLGVSLTLISIYLINRREEISNYWQKLRKKTN
ncbi:MAG: DMT family transporter [Cyanobacteria bacterium J083]|nr:MAG: DMT family transporter [Cyanobacteria bacterium J083]